MNGYEIHIEMLVEKMLYGAIIGSNELHSTELIEIESQLRFARWILFGCKAICSERMPRARLHLVYKFNFVFIIGNFVYGKTGIYK